MAVPTYVAAALNGNRVIASYWYTGTTTASIFEDWFKTRLLPCLRKGSTVILDNARFHRKTELIPLAGKVKVRLLFLPPYSPDFNPIEKTWVNMKRWLRDNASYFPVLQDAVYAYLL
ncbi:MAG: transposase [Treponema sp.]|nr:transposase [Treponema sp.]